MRHLSRRAGDCLLALLLLIPTLARAEQAFEGWSRDTKG